MDLYSGLPYWIVKNPLYNLFHPLTKDHTTEVVIIGSGITGALVAHELCEAGIKCTIVDKRGVANGSSVASTALLQYEIDTPLSQLVKMMEEKKAVLAYQSCLCSITDLEEVFRRIQYNPDFKRVPSIYYASNHKGLNLIKQEFITRKKYNLPVRYLTSKELYNSYGFKAPGALINHSSAQIDTYDAATHLIDYHRKRGQLEVFTHTEVTDYEARSTHYELQTSRGHKLTCSHVIIATGFEAGKFLPQKVMKLTSTYAIISQPLEEKHIWPERSLIWETKSPYLYIRTTNKNRIIVGGEDVEFRNPVARDRLLREKVAKLEKKFKKLYPSIPFVTDMTWCGTFSSTRDGLPFIGNWPGNDRMLYALGYGGNGITFSMIAAQIIRNKLKGIADKREEVFSFDRIT